MSKFKKIFGVGILASVSTVLYTTPYITEVYADKKQKRHACTREKRFDSSCRELLSIKFVN